MLDQLKQIIESRVRCPIDIKPLQKYGQRPKTPLDATFMARDFAQLAQGELIRPAVSSTKELAAYDLINFIAEIPDWIIAEIQQSNTFKTSLGRAWEEPYAGAYVGLCSTVQDVWEHNFGPEVNDDQAILEVINNIAKGKLLDYGCGTGYFSISLGQMGNKVDCHDVDHVKLCFLEYRIQIHQLSGQLQIQEPTAHYDTVLAINVLDHLQNPEKFVQAFRKWLLPDGKLVLLAAFPEDDWHQSDAKKRELTAETLLAHMNEADTVAYEVKHLELLFLRSQPEVPKIARLSDPEALASKPKLHYKAQFRPHSNNPDLAVVLSDSFYVEPMFIDECLVPLLKSCNGKTCLAELLSVFEFDLEDVRPFIEYAETQRALFIDTL